MGHHIFFFSVIFITLVTFSSGADREFTVKIHQRYLLACSESSDPGNLKDIDWYHCSLGLEKDGCDKGGKQFLIAQVRNMRETITYNPNFDVYTNGTLVIKKVLPMDDGVMFICSARVRFLRKESFTTILNIAREPPKLIPTSPRLINVIEGMDLYMDALVQGYPYPSVTWSHDGLLLQNTWNNDSETSLIIRSVTVYESGQYTCYAKNSLGDNIFTVYVDVYVQDFQTPQSSLTSETHSPSASPPPKTQSPSTSPPPSADHEFTVKIHQRYLLACSESNDLRPGNFKYIDWYRCSPNLKKDGCDSDGKTVLIVQVKFTRETKVYNRDFDVYTNGTLVIKKVLPMDDGEMFVCSAFVRYIKRANFTVILNIAKEPPKLIPKSPLSIEVIEGTTLYMDTEVQGYPYPWVTWSHNELLLKETPNVDSETFLRIRNVTVDKKGRYTCFANNQLGNSSFTVSVKVKAKAAISEKSFMPTRPNFPTNLGQLVTTTAASDFHTPPSSLPSDFQTPPSLLTSNFQTPPFSLTSNFQSPPYSLTSETQSPSGSATPTLNSVCTANCECPYWLIYVLTVCLVIAVAVIIAYLGVKIKSHIGSSRGHRDKSHIQNAGFELDMMDDNQPASK